MNCCGHVLIKFSFFTFDKQQRYPFLLSLKVPSKFEEEKQSTELFLSLYNSGLGVRVHFWIQNSTACMLAPIVLCFWNKNLKYGSLRQNFETQVVLVTNMSISPYLCGPICWKLIGQKIGAFTIFTLKTCHFMIIFEGPSSFGVETQNIEFF
jgi:hypothetical protein